MKRVVQTFLLFIPESLIFTIHPIFSVECLNELLDFLVQFLTFLNVLSAFGPRRRLFSEGPQHCVHNFKRGQLNIELLKGVVYNIAKIVVCFCCHRCCLREKGLLEGG
jgi:hypothetical protein